MGQGSLSTRTSDSVAVGPFRMANCALVVDGEPSFDEWREAGRFFSRANGATLWWVGDWLNYGEFRWKETYQEASEQTGLEKNTLRKAKYIAALFESGRRIHTLTFDHHRLVAPVPARKADEFLNEASRYSWSTRELKQVVNQWKNGKRASALPDGEPCTIDDLDKLISSGQTFGCIYADPPWSYGNQGTRAATDNHYETMDVAEIAALPVEKLAGEKCHLHLWTTNGFLKDAISMLEGWGFEFKSTFIWVKPQLGIGNYWRCSHEILLLGVKGGLTFPPTNIKSWIEHKRSRHSAKPEAVRQLIEKVSPGPWLELFGRRAIDGWIVWGNQIERDIFESRTNKL